MSDPKIGWRKLDGENAWVGVRGRVKFFTLRLKAKDPKAYEGMGVETYELPYALTYHTVDSKQENLNLMRLAEAQAHAERELDNWLAKAGLIDVEPPTPANKAVESAQAIVNACVEDGVTSLVNTDHQDRLATRIAFYVVASVMDELGQLKIKALEKGEEPTVRMINDRREELTEVFSELAEILR